MLRPGPSPTSPPAEPNTTVHHDPHDPPALEPAPTPDAIGAHVTRGRKNHAQPAAELPDRANQPSQ